MIVALMQENPIVGALEHNAQLLRAGRAQAKAEGATCLVASELFLTGYPPEDLVLKSSFVERCRALIEDLVSETNDGGPATIFGAPWVENGQLYNSVIAAEGGQFSVRHKVHLPNYAVFDEMRLFTSGPLPLPVEINGQRVGLPICEDIWFPDVCAHLKSQGADILISPNGSPYEIGKHGRRISHAQARARETNLPLIYVNQFGGQDELIFDGRGFLLSKEGELLHQMRAWETDFYTVDCKNIVSPSSELPHEDVLADMYHAAMIGLRDYVEKNRFPGVLLGLSGGVDSAICAVIAADALGPDRVQCIMLPSVYTSQSSLDDAAACAAQMGVRFDTMSIKEMVAAGETTLAPLFGDRPRDITEENIQSRIRGTLLMAVSNKLGSMVVTTGNKSEVSVGYSTLYGDMNGGYNPIKDIYKTDVFALCDWRNAHVPIGGHLPKLDVIPRVIIDKPPSAELRDDQKDEDSLPPYEVLDGILRALVEGECGFNEIIAQGYDADTVKRIEHLLYVSEYKRRQSAPGPKVGHRNFGRDRRYPITNGFRDAPLKG